MEFDLVWPRPPAPPSADMGNVAGLAAILRRAVAASLEAQRSHWMLWLPVALAAGAAVYFALPVEPHGLLALLAAGLALVLAGQIRRGRRGPPVILIAACAAGFVAAKARTLALDTVLLPAPTGAVMLTGRIV